MGSVKGGLSLKINIYIFICTSQRQNNALVEYIDNWTKGEWHERFLVLAGNLKVGKPMLCFCFFFQFQHKTHLL